MNKPTAGIGGFDGGDSLKPVFDKSSLIIVLGPIGFKDDRLSNEENSEKLAVFVVKPSLDPSVK
jgi:hypothetical protein